MTQAALDLRAKQLPNAPRARSGVAPPIVTGSAALPAGAQRHQALESGLPHELDLAVFEDRYLVAGTAGQRVLDAMASAGGRIADPGLRRSLADPLNVDVVVRQLVDRGLVCKPIPSPDGFVLPLFDPYRRGRVALTERAGRR